MYSQIMFLAQATPEGRVFGLDMQTVFGIGIQLLNGIILTVALSVILYKPVREFLRKRTEKIQNKIETSDATMEKANMLITEYETKLKDIEKERIEILEAARSKATEESRNILEEARKEASEIKKRSLKSVSEDKKRLEIESRIYIIEIASLMAQKYISENIDNESQERIFEETLAKLEESKWQQ